MGKITDDGGYRLKYDPIADTPEDLNITAECGCNYTFKGTKLCESHWQQLTAALVWEINKEEKN